MYAGIVPQHDFFIYVPLIREQQGSAKSQTCCNIVLAEHESRECEERACPVLTRWTRVALPGQLTVYTHICGDEEC
jgi:hypothetical protein